MLQILDLTGLFEHEIENRGWGGVKGHIGGATHPLPAVFSFGSHVVGIVVKQKPCC